jgi:hypothetical protein
VIVQQRGAFYQAYQTQTRHVDQCQIMGLDLNAFQAINTFAKL